MRQFACIVLLGCLCWLHVSSASAHFLFIRIGPHAEAGRGVEVFFSERAAAGDPMFVEKIAHTQLWMQTTPGEFQPLEPHKGVDRLRAFLPASGTVTVVGSCEYGVLARKIPFLLRYYPKAIAGDPAQLNEAKPCDKLPLEIMATIKGDEIVLQALQNGKPLPGVKFTTVDDDLVNEELQADDAGRATWQPSAAGHYCVYTSVVTPRAGELQGKKYTEIREFATLAFRWPLQQTDADAKAVALFQEALATRAAWREFPGFHAKVRGVVDGRSFNGSVQVGADGAVDVKIDEAAAAPWVEDQLGSIAMHRIASDSRGPAPVLHFADDDTEHPLGRLLTFVGGHFASSYRIRDRQITVVNRNLGDKNMTITVLRNEQNSEGKYLPREYTVQYWSAKTGSLDRTETIQNSWQRVERWDLPVGNTIVTASSVGLTVRSFELSDLQLISPTSTP
jgi:hypothetical protein